MALFFGSSKSKIIYGNHFFTSRYSLKVAEQELVRELVVGPFQIYFTPYGDIYEVDESRTEQPEIELIPNQKYLVIWDGIEYECIAEDCNFYNGREVELGNASIVGLEDDTNEPFVFGWHKDYRFNLTYTTQSDESHIVEIYKLVEPSEMYIYNNETLAFTRKGEFYNYNYQYESYEVPKPLKGNCEYRVIWDGVEYYCTSKIINLAHIQKPDVNLVFLGNAMLNPLFLTDEYRENTDEPFFIQYLYGQGLEVESKETVCIDTQETEDSHVITLQEINTEGEGDSSDNNFENYNVLIADFNDIQGYTEEYYDSIGLIAGRSYKVIYNNEVYICTAKSMSMDGIDGIGLGNESFTGVGEDTGEPFLIGDVAKYSTSLILIMEAGSNHTISIYSKQEIIENIELLHSGNYYFSYSENSSNVIQGINLGGYHPHNIPTYLAVENATYIFEQGTKYNIIIDGKEYNDVKGFNNGSGVYYVGDNDLEEYPFCFYYIPAGIGELTQNSIYYHILDDSSGSHDIIIYKKTYS